MEDQADGNTLASTNTRRYAKICIYALCEPGTTRVRYVGKTQNKPTARCNGHLSKCATEPKSHKNCWLKSLKSKGLRPDVMILEELADCSDEDWKQRERHWIKFGREQGWDLTNNSAGGEGGIGVVRSEDFKREVSAALKGIIRSPATKALMAASATGRVPTAMTRQKIGDANRGRITSEDVREVLRQKRLGAVMAPESRAKVSAAQTGRKRTAAQIAAMREVATNPSEETRQKMRMAKLGKRRVAPPSECFCLGCQKPFVPRDRRFTKYCSPQCSVTAASAARSLATKIKRAPRACANCGITLRPSGTRQNIAVVPV